MAIDKKRERERTNKNWKPGRETEGDFERQTWATGVKRKERERENWHADK